MTTDAAEVRVEQLAPDAGPALGPFLTDLLTGSGPGTQFLAPVPADAAGWATRLEACAAATSPIPAALAEALVERQVALGAGPQAVENARRLAATGRRTVAIVTGQQPGLLGGPLLTLHKAAGAVALARQLADVCDVDVVPVYWLASEDHDFDEANRAAVLAHDGQTHRVRLPLDATGQSIVDLEVPEALRTELLAAVADLLPDTERARSALALARPEANESFAAWSVRTLVALLGDTGLVVIEPEQLDPWVAPSYAWLLDHAETINTAIRDTGAALIEAGLPAPLAPEPGDTALFFREAPAGPRLRVQRGDGEAIRLRGAPSAFDVDELKRRWADDPRLGAGNVIGRVFVQNRHLPVFAYVAGPTEIAYQAQLAAAARELGIPFPLALPRPEATWVRARDHAAAESLGLTIGSLLRGDAPPPPPDDAAAGSARDALDTHLDQLPAELLDLARAGGRSADALRRLEARLAAAVEKAWPGVLRALEADRGLDRGRLARLRAALRPHGKPQERLLSPLSIVARHGVDALRAGLGQLNPLVAAHQVITIADTRSEA